jgi:transcription antitermination factor NusG
MAPRKAKLFWAALTVGYGDEQRAMYSVTDLVVDAYNPQMKSRGTSRSVLPGYLLVKLRRGQHLGEVSRAKHVTGYLGEVDRADVEWIRSLENSAGYVEPDKVASPPTFAFGDRVMALSGVAKHCAGEYRGLDRTNYDDARILFRVLGREVRVSVPRRDLVLSA